MDIPTLPHSLALPSDPLRPLRLPHLRLHLLLLLLLHLPLHRLLFLPLLLLKPQVLLK